LEIGDTAALESCATNPGAPGQGFMFDRNLREPLAFGAMGSELIAVNPWMMLPFGILLAMIALGPLLFPSWWTRHYPKVACGLGGVTLIYYFFGLHASHQVWHIAHEYLSFIALIGSLFIVSGGIHISVKGEATPIANAIFLLIGAVLANILGTTGASMLLIGPWLRMNKYRVTAHHVVFFIFIVSNVGGCLTPIGDPPLLLGYLSGIPFWWVAKQCLPSWAVGLGMLLLIFLALDYRNYFRAPKAVREELTAHEEWRFEGLGNILFLGVILIAIFIHHPPFLREALMAFAAFASYFTTRKPVHDANHFTFHPIREVAVLFIGIFATMMPALDWLQSNSGRLENATPATFYWGSGLLSGFLDNAPTYLCFLKVIVGRFVDADIVGQVNHLIQNHGSDLATLTGPHAEQIRQTFFALQKYQAAALADGTIGTDQIEVAYLLGNPALHGYIVAVSIGSVFFGASTYIANGPNFIVKSVAEHQNVPTPSFLGYILKFTVPFMAPMLLVVWWLFFRN
jgi:Na+/H+ antiporter NhaD/arsenite permease-like protein